MDKDPTTIPEGALGESSQGPLAEILQRFEAAWKPNDGIEIADYLPEAGEALRHRALVELIKLDQRLQWRSAEPRLLEDYLDTWPGLTQDGEVMTELLASECLSRSAYATVPDTDELRTRFPEASNDLCLEDIEERAREMRSESSFGGSDRFVVVRKVGAGGMGVVYEVHDAELNVRVALKTLPQVRPTSLYRFKREFRALAEIDHPNLVRLYELIASQGRWFFTMDLVDGVSLLEWLRPGHDPSSSGVADDLDEPVAVRYDRLGPALRQLVMGIGALHEAGKLHRDIKPSNVLVRADGQVMLLDFGLVTELDHESEDEIPAAGADQPEPDSLESSPGSGSDTTDHRLLGTIPYMAPEQAAQQPLGPASDWYAVGAMVYEVLTGKHPFTGPPLSVLMKKRSSEPPPPSELVEGVPPWLDQLCIGLLRRDPAQRLGGSDILEQLGDGPTVDAVPGSVRFPALELPLVGRERYLSELQKSLAEVKGGATVVTAVSGTSGSGKSTLVQAFLDELASREDVVALAGRCFEQESVPFKALDSLVDALSRYLVRLPRHDADVLMPHDVVALARVFPVLQRVEAVAQAPGASMVVPDVRELRRRAFLSLRQLLLRMGDRCTLVLAIDDLQWGDLDSVVVLLELLRPPDVPRLLLLVCHRSEDREVGSCVQVFRDGLPPAGDGLVVRHLDLEPLSDAEAEDLALALAGEGAPIPAALLRQIAGEAGGSPFIVSELVRYIREGADAAELTMTLSGQDLVRGVLRQRHEALSAPSRRLVEVLAVASCPLTLRVAAQVAQLDPSEQQGTVASLKNANQIRTSGPGLDDTLEPYHDRLREGVLSNLTAGSRTRHHRQLALALEASDDADPETIAVHYLAAGERERAGRFQADAAEKAAQFLAFERAARLYREALANQPMDIEAKRVMRLALAESLANAGRGIEAAKEFESLSDGASLEEGLDLRRQAAYQYCIGGYVDAGREAFKQVLKHVGVPMPATPRRALLGIVAKRFWGRLRGLSFHERSEDMVPKQDLRRIDMCWDAATALTLVDTIRGAYFQSHNLKLSLRAGEPYRVARAMMLEALHLSMAGSGRGHSPTELLERAEGLAERLDNPHIHGLALLVRGSMAFFLGRWTRSLQLCDEAQSHLRAHCTGVAWELDTAATVGLWCLTNLGEITERRHRVGMLLDDALQRGDLYAVTSLRVYHIPLALLFAEGNPEAARRCCDEALAAWTQKEYTTQHAVALLAQLYIDLATGDGQTAWKRLEDHWPRLRGAMLLRSQVMRSHLLHLRGSVAMLLAATSSERKGHIRNVEKIIKQLRREKVPWAGALASMLTANLVWLQGDRADAVEAFGKAVRELEEGDLRYYAHLIRYRHGYLLGGEEGERLMKRSTDFIVGHGYGDGKAAIKMPLSMFTPGF